MMDFIFYAVASFYFILSNLDVASQRALSAIAQIPFLQSNNAVKQIDSAVNTVVLPNSALRIVAATTLSLLTYPLVCLTNYVLQLFVYWLALFGFIYLSLSKNDNAYQFVVEKISQISAQLKLHAPLQFQKLLALFPVQKVADAVKVAEVELQEDDDSEAKDGVDSEDEEIENK